MDWVCRKFIFRINCQEQFYRKRLLWRGYFGLESKWGQKVEPWHWQWKEGNMCSTKNGCNEMIFKYLTAGPSMHWLIRMDIDWKNLRMTEWEHSGWLAAWWEGPIPRTTPCIPRSTKTTPDIPADMGEWNPSPV